MIFDRSGNVGLKDLAMWRSKMSKGYMAKVAETLGVEIGEVFKISKENSNEKFTKYFRITHDNIEESEYQFLYSHWDTCNSEVLLRLLNGSLTLRKLS